MHHNRESRFVRLMGDRSVVQILDLLLDDLINGCGQCKVTVSYMKNTLGLSDYKARKALDKLRSAGAIIADETDNNAVAFAIDRKSPLANCIIGLDCQLKREHSLSMSPCMVD